MRSRWPAINGAPFLGQGICLLVLLLALSSQFPASLAINAYLDRPGFVFQLRDYVGYLAPKMDGQIPLGSTGVDIGPAIIFETIPGDSSQLMNFRDGDAIVDLVTSSSHDTLAGGAVRWRFEVRSQLLLNPASYQDVLLQVYEIFDQDTTASLYGAPQPISVRADTVYYSQVIDMSHWNASITATGFRIVTWCNLYTQLTARHLIGYQSPVDVRHVMNAPEFSFEMISFPSAVVDGAVVSAPLTDSLVDGDQLLYSTIQNLPLPTTSAIQYFQIRVGPGSDARLSTPVKLKMEGYKKSALIVGLVLGIPAVLLILGFGVYFFCLAAWIPIWRVISIPGYAVAGRARLLYRPPAPTFQEDDNDEEDEDDPLGAERVDAEELMKFTASAVGTATSLKHARQTSSGSTDNVLVRLRKAMGRRLSNFVGWDGPPPGSSAVPSDRSPSPKKKDKHSKKHVKQQSSSSNGRDGPHIVTPEMMPNMVELEGSSGSNININIQRFAGRANEADSGVGLLTDRDESPSPLRHPPASQSMDDSEELVSSNFSEDEPPRTSAPLRGGREAPSAENDPPRAKKAPGLRHFKITSSLNSSTTDVTAVITSGTSANPDSSIPHPSTEGDAPPSNE